MKASELYKAGSLDEAIAAAIEQVKTKPGDAVARWLLTELLCFAGDFERADKQADALMVDPKYLMVVATYRQTIRAEFARQQLLIEGRLPEFLEPPSQEFKLRLQAIVALRERSYEQARELLAEAEGLRPHVTGEANGKAFDDFRDLDDLTSGLVEVLTSTGKYYWVPFNRIESMSFLAAQQPKDLIWRTVRMVVDNGPDGEVFIPSLYLGTPALKDDNQLRLGRATTWQEEVPGLVLGKGLRTFLAGEEDVTVSSLTEIRFNRD